VRQGQSEGILLPQPNVSVVETGTGASQEDKKKTKKKSRLTVDDIPTTTDVPRNQCRYTNRNQPNISPLSKNKKWYSINKFFCGTRTTPADLCHRLEPSFFAGIVFPTAMTTTTESPLWDAILFFHN